MLESAVTAGVDVREHTRIDSVVEDGGGVLVGDVRGRVAVVTAGAWAPVLVGVDATPTRETTSYFALDEPLPSVIEPNGGSAHGYALVAPGVGMKAGLHQSGPTVDPDEPGGADAEIAERTVAWVERRFRVAGPAVRVETCLYTRRQNDEFLLERRGQVVVGSPCSGHGFKFAPLIGKRLAALAEEAL
jgi:sarcosine oxidase